MLRSVTKVQPKDSGDGFAEVHLEQETSDDHLEKVDKQEKEDKKNEEEKAETVGLMISEVAGVITRGPGVTMMGPRVVTRSSLGPTELTRPGSDENCFCSAKIFGQISDS